MLAAGLPRGEVEVWSQGSDPGQLTGWGWLIVPQLYSTYTQASSVWTCLTSKIWSQTGIISRQHPVQNLVNHSSICTIFAKTEKSLVNSTLLLREQKQRVHQVSTCQGLPSCTHADMYSHTCRGLSVLLSLPTVSQPEARL